MQYTIILHILSAVRNKLSVQTTEYNESERTNIFKNPRIMRLTVGSQSLTTRQYEETVGTKISALRFISLIWESILEQDVHYI